MQTPKDGVPKAIMAPLLAFGVAILFFLVSMLDSQGMMTWLPIFAFVVIAVGVLMLLLIPSNRRQNQPGLTPKQLEEFMAGKSLTTLLKKNEQPPPVVTPKTPEHALNRLDWFQLEQLVARLFEFKGNQVVSRGGAKGDGGVDLVVQFMAVSALVQCKHWNKWKCGPAVVRELLGAMTHERYSKGFLVCREASLQAKKLAAQHDIRIIERSQLLQTIMEAITAQDKRVVDALFFPKKICPKCGAKMVRRHTSDHSGNMQEFWGCSRYPRCRMILRDTG